MFLETLLCGWSWWQVSEICLTPAESLIKNRVHKYLGEGSGWVLQPLYFAGCLLPHQTPLCSQKQLKGSDPKGRAPTTPYLFLCTGLAITTHLCLVVFVCPYSPDLSVFNSNPHLLKDTAEILSPAQSSASHCIRAFSFPLFFLIGDGILIETFWVKTFLDINGQQRRWKWNCCNFNEYIQFY